MKSIYYPLFFATAMMILFSCSKKVYFPSSAVVPAARGFVKIKKDGNNNYSIYVNVINLAEVDRLPGSYKHYVVWMNDNEQFSKNIGMIKSDTKMFSNKLDASFHSVTASKPTKIFITAEEDGTAQYPGNFVILSSDIK